MKKDALIIFAKNAVKGKVKTRLAASIGDDEALETYQALLLHTFEITMNFQPYKVVYFSEHIEYNFWNEGYDRAVQHGDNLGERMRHAFAETFKKGYNKIVIIGTDCPGLTQTILEGAYSALNAADIVIGPAYDGGYYLLGMKIMHDFLFENIPWSTATVLEKTIDACRKKGLTVSFLPELHDIDEAKDLAHLQHMQP